MDLSDYDDTPYRERDDVAPVYTISMDLDPTEDGRIYVYVDDGDVRLARQEFPCRQNITGLHTGMIEWVNKILLAVHTDPEGRNACGDCGNYTLNPLDHAPDCRWSRWAQRQM